MGIALFATVRLFSPLSIAMGRLLPFAGPVSVRRFTPPAPSYCGKSGNASTPIQHPTPRLPLRVVRLVESGHTAACAGRMTISGSMADVCAELDRLAAAEHTRH